MKQAREFTEASGTQWPAEPRLMTQDEADFIIKMVMDELLELGSCFYDAELNKSKMMEAVRDAKSLPKESEPRMEDMADSLGDVVYYCANAAAKVGYDLDAVLEEIHEANMRKRGPDGVFIKNEMGKVLKPAGFVPPNIKRVLAKRPGTEVFAEEYQDPERVSARVHPMNQLVLMICLYVTTVFMIKFYHENVIVKV